jgi:hypothetical protein
VAFNGEDTAREFEAMLRRQLKRGSAAAAACAGFDPELANAYLEHALNNAARHRYEDHLAACPACRRQVIELFRLMPHTEMMPALPSAPPAPSPSFFARWFDFSSWRWGMVATAGVAAVLLSAVGVQVMRQARRSQAVDVAQMAQPGPVGIASAEQPQTRPEMKEGDVNQPLASAPASAKPERTLQQQVALSDQVAAKKKRDQQAGQAASTLPLPAATQEFATRLERLAKNTVSGTVSDPSGAVIPGAQVTLIDPASQQARAATRTNASGQFNFANVPQGNYLVEAQAAGFKAQQTQTLVLDLPRKGEPLTLQLEPGTVSETVTVLAGAEAARRAASGFIKPPPGGVATPTPPANPFKLQADKALEERAADRISQDRAAKLENVRSREQARNESERQAKEQTADEKRDQKDAPAAALARRAEPMPGETGRRAAAPPPPPASVPAVAPKSPARAREADKESLALPTRKVGVKRFRFERGVWLDNDYKPEDRLPLTRLVRDSEEYKQTLKAVPALKPFFNLGQVTVVWAGKVYEVREKK